MEVTGCTSDSREVTVAIDSTGMRVSVRGDGCGRDGGPERLGESSSVDGRGNELYPLICHHERWYLADGTYGTRASLQGPRNHDMFFVTNIRSNTYKKFKDVQPEIWLYMKETS